MVEFPQLSLDRFDGSNLTSTVYFLSHCHADHMVGLDTDEFFVRLSSYSFKLYCSDVTAGLLKGISRFERLSPYVQTLPTMDEHCVPVPDLDGSATRDNISVTLIPAGHCPGSVMFLIQGEVTVLYTGDFRFGIGDTSRYLPYLPSGATRITSVYVDTTFCIPEAEKIPSRQECLQLIYGAVSDWLQRPGERVVHVFSRSSYGYEFLMMALFNKFGRKIHVTETQFRRYRFVPTLADILTTKPQSAQIHFCQQRAIVNVEERMDMCLLRPAVDKSQLPCAGELTIRPNVLQIIPSVMYFTKSRTVSPTEMTVCENETTVRMCYSSHSSYEEIRDFLTAIKPEHIYPNVCPNSNVSLDDVRRNLLHLQHPRQILSEKRVTSSSKQKTVYPCNSEAPALGVTFSKKRKLWYHPSRQSSWSDPAGEGDPQLAVSSSAGDPQITTTTPQKTTDLSQACTSEGGASNDLPARRSSTVVPAKALENDKPPASHVVSSAVPAEGGADNDLPPLGSSTFIPDIFELLNMLV